VRDKIGIGDDVGNIVVGDNGRASQPDLLDLPGHSSHFDAVADGDGPFRQDDDTLTKLWTMFCIPKPTPTLTPPAMTRASQIQPTTWREM